MYKPGDVAVESMRRRDWDYRQGDTAHNNTVDRVAYLPHSCDEWIIGGPDQVRALIADLTAVLAQLDAR